MFKKSKGLPEVPATIDQHPDWLRHAEQLQRLEQTAAASGSELARLEDERRTVKAALEEARVGILLGETQAGEQVSTHEHHLTQLDATIAATRERASVEQAAVRRIQERGVAILGGQFKTDN